MHFLSSISHFLTLLLSLRMNVAAGPELAAAVTNAGGLGVIGGVGYTPKILRQQVRSAYLWHLGLSSLVLTFYF